MNRKQARSRWAEILGHDAEITGHVGPKYPDWMAFYNHRRQHSSLGYLSPMQYEQRWYEAQRKKAA